MNEIAQARSICRHLDDGTEQLPYRVQTRLAAARASALAALPDRSSARATVSPAGESQPSVGPLRLDRPASTEPRTPFWWRLAATALPALVLVIGFVVGDSIQEDQSVDELAEVDSALLTDEIPLVAYADHGFGVYLKNTRR